MLIKKLKSTACCFSTPISKPQTKVEPLREIPGSKASPWANPMPIAVFLLIDFLPLDLKSAITSKTAEIKKPQINVLVEKLCSKNLLNNKTNIMVGMVAIIKFV